MSRHLPSQNEQLDLILRGVSEVISEDKAKAMGIRELVMKPLVMRDLAQTVRKVLDE